MQDIEPSLADTCTVFGPETLAEMHARLDAINARLQETIARAEADQLEGEVPPELP